jgi:hypothetical protein
MMTPAKRIALRCKISQGGFSGEMIFRVALNDGEEYVGAAPPQYFSTAEGNPLRPEQLARGKTVHGKIEARLIKEEQGGTLLVAVPDGQVLTVNPDQITELPTRIFA